MRQKVSKENKRAFSINSSWNAARKKSLANTLVKKKLNIFNTRTKKYTFYFYLVAFSQLNLSSVKVKINIQALDKFSDRIFIVIRFLLNDLDQLFHDILSALANNGCRCNVTQDVWASCLHSVQIAIRDKKIRFNKN